MTQEEVRHKNGIYLSGDESFDEHNIYAAMDEWADIKVGEFISKQTSFTETTVVPAYILDEYAKKECIAFMEAYQYGRIPFEKEPDDVNELYELYFQSKRKAV